jgi:phosphoribosyl 1,2-cyclic phosphodiesterase
VELQQGNSHLALDAGSGLRVLGLRLGEQGSTFADEPFYVLVTHYHWDHIQGFPFFEFCYREGSRITVCSAVSGLEDAFRTQMSPPFFPKSLDDVAGEVTFQQFSPDQPIELGEFTVRAIDIPHPNGASGYRVEGGGASVVYLTDMELQAAEEGVLDGLRSFCSGADLIIADTQFGRGEITRKADWGHSSVFQFIELLAGRPVARLALFHYDPKYTDEIIDDIYKEAVAFAREQAPDWPCELIASHEGLELSLPASEPARPPSLDSGGAGQ